MKKTERLASETSSSDLRFDRFNNLRVFCPTPRTQPESLCVRMAPWCDSSHLPYNLRFKSTLS